LKSDSTATLFGRHEGDWPNLQSSSIENTPRFVAIPC
jgi:hypothetical protein